MSRKVTAKTVTELRRDYAKKCRANQSRNDLVEKYERFVGLQCKKFKCVVPRGSLNWDDLFQEGQIALIKAAAKYRPDKNTFGAYAGPTIISELNRYLMNNRGPYYQPERWHKDKQLLHQSEDFLAGIIGHPPTDQELAIFLECPVEKIRFIRQLVTPKVMLSLDKKIGRDENTSWSEIIPDHNGCDPHAELWEKDWPALLQTGIESLSHKNQSVIRKLLSGLSLSQMTGGQTQKIAQIIELIHDSIRQLRRHFGTDPDRPIEFEIKRQRLRPFTEPDEIFAQFEKCVRVKIPQIKSRSTEKQLIV